MNLVLPASPQRSPASAQCIRRHASIRAATPSLLLSLLVLGASASASAAGEVALVTGLSTRLMLAGASELTPPPAPPDLGPDPANVAAASSSHFPRAPSWGAEDDQALQLRLTGLRLELESLPKPGPSGLVVGGVALTLASLGIGVLGLPVTLLGIALSMGSSGAGMMMVGTLMITAGLIGIPIGAVLWIFGEVGQDAEKRKLNARKATLIADYNAIAAELRRRSGEATLVAPALPGM